MKSNKKNEFVYYGDVLSKLDIIYIGLSIVKYEQNQITYKELKEILAQKNIQLNPLLRDFSTVMVTIIEFEELKNKLEKEEYEPEHLRGYIISSAYYKNVLIRYDRLMIENLAEYRDEYSKQVLKSLVEWEQRQSRFKK